MQRTSLLARRALTQLRAPPLPGRASIILKTATPRINAPVRSHLQRSLAFRPRYSSSLSVPEGANQQDTARPPVPSYQLTFTCKPCKHRSTHRVTKQGYHHGTVLIQCPNCKSRHVISDHLKIFMDEASTLEDILQRTAGTENDISKLLKKGRLGQREGQLVANEGEEDLEFWDDGTTTKHTPSSSQ